MTGEPGLAVTSFAVKDLGKLQANEKGLGFRSNIDHREGSAVYAPPGRITTSIDHSYYRNRSYFGLNTMTTSLSGVLFDFDGTLADTMNGHYLAWRLALKERDIHIEQTDYYPLEGAKLHDVARVFAKGPKWTVPAIDALVQRKKELYISGKPITFFPGVELLISELSNRRVPMGIVTAGYLDQLELSVPRNFLQQFDAVITGDQVTRGKPNPESYLLGAKHLGLQPDECIAVENAPLGIRSAKQANIYCIAICSTVDRNLLLEADETLESFEQLRYSEQFQHFLEPKPE